MNGGSTLKLLNTTVEHAKKDKTRMQVAAALPSAEVNAEGDFGHFRSSEQHTDGTNYQATRWVRLPINVPFIVP